MIVAGGDDLLRLDDLEIGQLVAQARRVFELQVGSRALHAPAQLLLHLVVAPFQHLDGRSRIARVGLLGNQPDAGAGAALDLVLQAGPRAIGEVRVLAIAKAEQLLQLLQRLPNGAGRRIRAEKAAGLLARPAVEAEARKLVSGLEVQERKTFVVAQHHVETRPVLFDEIEFEKQRLRIRIRDGHFHAHGARHQRLDLGLHVAGQEIRPDAALEISRLADVQDHVLGIEHAIHARPRRQAVDERLGVELSREHRHGPLRGLSRASRWRARAPVPPPPRTSAW